MKITQASTVGLIGVALLVGTAAVGCGSDDKGSSASSSSSSISAAATTSAAASTTTSAAASPSAQGADYSNLLLKPTDIDPSLTANPPILNPDNTPGVGTAFLNPGHNQTIYFTILLPGTPDMVAAGVEGLKGALPSKVTGAPQPADVGSSGGTIASGTSPDGSKAITEVIFAQGKAIVNIEFESAANDPVLPETALAIAKMQDTQVKNNLPA